MENKQLIDDLQQIIRHQTPETTADLQTVLQSAQTAYENARTDGLCHEGAWEIALQTIKNST